MTTGDLVLPCIGVARRSRARFRCRAASTLSERLILALVGVGDVSAGMTGVVKMLQRQLRAARVEWWAPSADGSNLALEVADGRAGGARRAFSLGAAGALVVDGATNSLQLEPALDRLAPILRRQLAEERLAEQAALLARRNEALEDFAALVAHELKNPLQIALLEPGAAVEELDRALAMIDSILEASRSEGARATARAEECLADALRDLGPVAATIDVALPLELPLPATLLRIVLRNLIANAVAAGARTVSVAASSSRSDWQLTVDDDGVGVDSGSTNGYSDGSGVGLMLCRRIAERAGGALELQPLAAGGTRASMLLKAPER
jgi:signal transduction histidine kinase